MIILSALLRHTEGFQLCILLPGASLEQMHIFALAHILRRPIIVYGVKVVKSFRGESIDFARFEGKLRIVVALLGPRNKFKLQSFLHSQTKMYLSRLNVAANLGCPIG